MSSNSLTYTLNRPLAVSPRGMRPVARRAHSSRKALARQFLLAMLAAAEHNPLMGVYVATRSNRD